MNKILAKYDTIGTGYNDTRKADPYLVKRLLHWLAPSSGGIYLDIGCGTGNYTHALQQKGLRFIGIDPSSLMLEKARARTTEIDWRRGTAEHTGLEDQSINGIIVTLSIHHWPDLNSGFRELGRVLKPGGSIVIFTSTPEQMKGYWLNAYFPKMLQDSIEQMPSKEKVMTAMKKAGIATIQTETYEVKAGLEDHFLYCGKHRPELYFDPVIRNGISSFSSLAVAEEVKKGLQKLETDVRSGKIIEIIRSYENTLGDYLFISGIK